jgi:hypothetical protein
MRCGHAWVEAYDPKATMTEQACPKCRSNSVRPLAEVGAAKK